MDDPNSDEAFVEPANIRFLRLLVTVLTAVMICGFLVLIALFVTRLGAARAPLALPDFIVLPDGTQAAAFTQGSDWYAVVTDGDEILIFDRASGALRQTIAIE
jgi:hypothetical protein